MNDLKGAAIIGQSGGPTSVINASAAGVFIEALKQKISHEFMELHMVLEVFLMKNSMISIKKILKNLNF